jgi:hypothetical protein
LYSKQSSVLPIVVASNKMNRVSLVGIATNYWLDGLGLIPGSAKIFLFFTVSGSALAPILFLMEWVQG